MPNGPASAVCRWSPVIIATSIPRRRRPSTARRDVSRIGSAAAATSAILPSTTTSMIVLPPASSRSRCACTEARSMSGSRISLAVPTSTSRPDVVPGEVLEPGDRTSVSVPVLSMTTAVMRETCSSGAAFLIRMLWRAPSPVPTATAFGVARPSASGQAITTAEMAKVSARSTDSRMSPNQTPNVTTAAPTARITRYWAHRSAMRWPGAFEDWAPSTSWNYGPGIGCPWMAWSPKARPRSTSPWSSF